MPEQPQGQLPRPVFRHYWLTSRQRMWGVYCRMYHDALWGIGCGWSHDEIRARAQFAESESRIVEILEAQDPHNAEVYVSIVRRATEDALAGRPPDCGARGFGKDIG